MTTSFIGDKKRQYSTEQVHKLARENVTDVAYNRLQKNVRETVVKFQESDPNSGQTIIEYVR